MGSAPRVDFRPRVDFSSVSSTLSSAATATAGSILSFAYNSLADTANGIGNEALRQSGAETPADKAARIAAEAQTEEGRARAQAVNDAITDNNIDTKTRQEIQMMYMDGISSTQLAAQVALAKEGKGIYGIRRIQNNQQKIQAAQPGRSQVLGRAVL